MRKTSDHYFFKLSDPRCKDFSASAGRRNGDHLQPEAAQQDPRVVRRRACNDWDISRDAPYFGFEIPDAPGKYLLRLVRRADRLLRQLQKLLRDRTGIDFDEF